MFSVLDRYRRKIFLQTEVEQRFKELVHEACEELQIQIVALECDKDHTHMFPNALPNLSPVDMMAKIKGVTYKKLREEFPHLRHLPSLWTRSYFVSTAGNVSSETIKRYVEIRKSEVKKELKPMARKSTSTYTLEFALNIPTWQQHRLEKKFKIAKIVYNSCLGEALKRNQAVKADKAYRTLLKESKSRERDKELADIRLIYGFSEYGIHRFVKETQHQFEEHIGSFEAQKLATRAFQTVEKLHFGKSKKVHFKKLNVDLSIENKSNKTGLRYIGGNIIWGDKPTNKNPKPKN